MRGVRGAGELNSCGSEPAKRRPIEIDKQYGQLLVLEKVERGGKVEGYRARCVNLRDGKECGNVVLKQAGYLNRDGTFRGCRSCADEYMRGARRRLSQSYAALGKGGTR